MMNKSSMTGCWIRLPQDIFRVIVTDLNYVDQVRFRAVCKTWRDSTDEIGTSLPLVTHYPWSFPDQPPGTKHRFTCDLFDPFSMRSHQTSNSIENLECLPMQVDDLTVFASKHGWVLLGVPDRRTLFLHNPRSNETMPLRKLKITRKLVPAATFTDDPKSPECEILAMCRSMGSSELWLYRYCPSRDTSWSVTSLGYDEDARGKFSMYCRKGYLYYLSEYGTLRSYNLVCGTLTTHPSKTTFASGYWMVESEEDLIIVCKHMTRSGRFWWSTYKLDSSMSCVPADWRSKKVAIFISGRTAISRTFKVQNKGDCLVFSQEVDPDDMYRSKVACYSMTNVKEVETKEYKWIDMSCCKKRMAFV